jgi:NADH-quinone oxidoreductase subunit C
LTELIGPAAFARAGAATAETAAPVVAAAAPAAAGATPASKSPSAAPPRPASPLETVAPALKGYDLDATVAPNQVTAAAALLDREGFALDAVTGVDWIAQEQMEVVYDYFHPVEPMRVVVRTRVPRGTPEVPTISGVFPGANWHERETHDFFGIRFAGHPNLTPFLLPEDADFHPLRKDYQP